MSLEPGAQLGAYTIAREIGRGGMGVVYLGRDTRLDRDVAIKSLPEHLASDPERLARFEREAKTLASLNHPNVAGIHGVEEVDGARYLILEYVEGETLADRLDRGGMSSEDAVEVAIQIASGVEAAHEAGVIHRDLKQGSGNQDGVRISPSGLEVAFTTDHSGSGEAYVSTLVERDGLPAMGPDRQRVQLEGVLRAEWARDGGTLFVSTEMGELYEVPVTRTETRFRLGRPAKLFDFPSTWAATNFTVAGDGERVLIPIDPLAEHQSLHVLTGWHSRLER
ncbi:MAG: serine/threonine-protein kinase [Planctomycetota bacterium]|jgi:serine/threonine protein kinase